MAKIKTVRMPIGSGFFGLVFHLLPKLLPFILIEKVEFFSPFTPTIINPLEKHIIFFLFLLIDFNNLVSLYYQRSQFLPKHIIHRILEFRF